jgi:hypothetical protein
MATGDSTSFEPETNGPGGASLRIQPLDRKYATAPITLRLERANPPASWTYTMQPRDVSSLRELHIPPGSYSLLLTADKHLPLKLTVAVSADAPARLGALALREAPVMTGRVIDKGSREPVPNAAILASQGETLAVTDAGGMFEFILVDQKLEEIVIEAPERAPKRVELRSALTASSLGDILVSRGGTAIVNIEFPESVREQVRVVVMDTSDPNEYVVIGETTIESHESSARFEDLEPGRYVAIVEGDNALERFSIDLPVDPGRSVEQIAKIRPNRIVVKTLFGDGPLPDGTVHVTHTNAGWKTEIHTNASGEFEGILWQPGTFLGAVSAAALPQPHIAFEELSAGDTSWELVVPNRRIVGRVLDRKTGQAIAGVSLNLSTRTRAARLNVGATSAEDGSFEFTAVKPGIQVLTAAATGYLRPDPLEFTVAENDSRIERVLELSKGAGHTLHVRNAGGAAIAGATVYAVAGAAVVATAATDSSGTASLPVPPGVSVAALVFPQEGAFSILRLPSVGADAPGEEFTVTVSPPLASLALTAKDPSGKPIGELSFLVRYEGEFLPPAVLSMQRRWMPTSEAGEAILQLLPTGFYELWPYRAVDEALAIIGAGGISPLRLGVQVSPGMNRAAFNLRPR